ncbi:MAG: hypothetical protein AB1716_06315 [Planctomycetota bacterium]
MAEPLAEPAAHAAPRAAIELDQAAGLPPAVAEEIVPIPVQAIPRPLSQIEMPDEPHAPPATPAEPTPIPAAPAQLADAAAAPASSSGSRLVRAVYRGVDGVLWAINRPFEHLAAEHRKLIGLVAIVTIVMSLAAGLVLPRVCPRNDVFSRIRARAAASGLHAPAAPAAQPNSQKSGH